MPSEGGSYVSTAIVGTPGYIDPEYVPFVISLNANAIKLMGVVEINEVKLITEFVSSQFDWALSHRGS